MGVASTTAAPIAPTLRLITWSSLLAMAQTRREVIIGWCATPGTQRGGSRGTSALPATLYPSVASTDNHWTEPAVQVAVRRSTSVARLVCSSTSAIHLVQ